MTLTEMPLLPTPGAALKALHPRNFAFRVQDDEAVDETDRKVWSDEVEAYNYAIGYFCSSTDWSRRPSGYEAVFPFNRNEELEHAINGDLVVPALLEEVDAKTGKKKLRYGWTRAHASEGGKPIKMKYVSKKRIDEYLSGQTTLYHRSRHDCVARTGYHSYDGAREAWSWAERFAITSTVKRFENIRWLLLGFDLDAKHGETDVDDLLGWLLTMFPGSYHEPSTSGSGRHLYVKLYFRADEKQRSWEQLDAVDRYVCRLAIHLTSRAARRFAASLDQIRSLPTLYRRCEKSGRIVVAKRYSCIKAPRCRKGMSEIEQFHFATFFSFRHILDLVKQFDEEDGIIAEDDLPVPPEPQNVVQPPEEQSINTSAPLLPTLSVPPTAVDRLEDLRRIDNTFIRKLRLCTMLRNKLERWLSPNECLDHYHDLRINNGPRDEEQEGAMLDAWEYARESYNASYRGLNLSGYEAARLELEALLGRPKLRWRKEAKKTRLVDPEFVWAIYFIVQQEERNSQGRISQKQIAERCQIVLNRKPHRTVVQTVLNYLRWDHLQMVAPPIWGVGRHSRGAKYQTGRAAMCD